MEEQAELLEASADEWRARELDRFLSALVNAYEDRPWGQTGVADRLYQRYTDFQSCESRHVVVLHEFARHMAETPGVEWRQDPFCILCTVRPQELKAHLQSVVGYHPLARMPEQWC